jgi:hypothetical protein
MTGNEQDVTWTIKGSSEEPTQEEVEASIKWRKANIVNRYGYRVADWSEKVDD